MEKKLVSLLASKDLGELLSSLPKEKRWNPFVDLYQYQGYWYPLVMLDGILSLQQHFQALPTDVIITGAPKTGNTWLKALCFAIATRTPHGNLDTNSLSKNLPHALIPILELGKPKNPKSATTNPRLLSTHLPYTSLPNSILSSGCKIIYICREPKDTCVSLWHYQTGIAKVGKMFLKEKMNFEVEFDRFCEGKVVMGPYLDHVLGYYEANMENPNRFLFLKYEDMKRDVVHYVKKVAAFIGKPFSVEEEAEGLPEEIAKVCSFEKLSQMKENKNGKTNLVGPFGVENRAYFRKGQVGDWRNYLSDEMVERLDRIVDEKLNGSSFRFGIQDLREEAKMDVY